MLLCHYHTSTPLLPLLSHPQQQQQPDEYREYDRLSRELLFELRAKPGDRSKTAEEQAEEERKRLEKLEVRERNGG